MKWMASFLCQSQSWGFGSSCSLRIEDTNPFSPRQKMENIFNLCDSVLIWYYLEVEGSIVHTHLHFHWLFAYDDNGWHKGTMWFRNAVCWCKSSKSAVATHHLSEGSGILQSDFMMVLLLRTTSHLWWQMTSLPSIIFSQRHIFASFGIGNAPKSKDVESRSFTTPPTRRDRGDWINVG